MGFGAGIGFTEDAIADHPLSDSLYDTLFNDLGLEALRIRNRYEDENQADLEVLRTIAAAATERLGRRPTLFISQGTPPAWLKMNSDRSCAGNQDTCTLAQAAGGGFDYAGFAAHWRASIEAYAGAGITFDYLGIQNNPNIVPSAVAAGEGCRFLPEENSMMVSVNGEDRLVEFPGYLQALSAVEAALSDLPDRPSLTAADVTGLQSTAPFVSPLDSSSLGAVSIHLYGVDPGAVDVSAFDAIRALASERTLSVLQTEIQANARDSAILLHHALASANASAYLQNDLVALRESNLEVALLRLTDDSFEPTPVYDVFAHYAAHTDPGWVRVGALTNREGLLVTAWLAPDEAALTIIAFNPTEEEVTSNLLLPTELQDTLTESRVMRTVLGGTERRALLGKLAGDGALILPPGSLVTVALVTGRE